MISVWPRFVPDDRFYAELRQSVGEQCVRAGSRAGVRLRPHEIRLDDDLLGGQPTRDES